MTDDGDPDDATLVMALDPTQADAVRLATRIIRSERFGDGNIGAAVNTGVLQAVLAALAVWYRHRLGRADPGSELHWLLLHLTCPPG